MYPCHVFFVAGQAPTRLQEEKVPATSEVQQRVVKAAVNEVSSNTRPAMSAKEQKEIDKMFSGLDDDFASSLSMDQEAHQAVGSISCSMLIFSHFKVDSGKWSGPQFN